MIQSKFVAVLAVFVGLSFTPLTTSADSLDDLLKQVKQSKIAEAKSNKAREAEFFKDKKRQKKLLADAKSQLKAEKKRGDNLKKAFDDNEVNLTKMEETLERRQGNLGELFGVVRHVSGDVAGIIEDSLVSVQYPNRAVELVRLSNEKKLPSIPELEELWYQMQHEMTESGKVVTYPGQIVSVDGTERDAEILRVGVFNVTSSGKFMRYLPETGQLIELPRQPSERFSKMAENLQSSSSGLTAMSVDPSRGSILALLVQAPTMEERIHQGKEVGYIIIGLALFGLLVALIRMLVLFLVALKVKSQLKNDHKTKLNNPLGRVLSVLGENEDFEVEVLERKIDEAVIREVPRLQSGLSIIKILAVTAPLLGLLGTVTGMIQTFQSITLFGTGDPKLMAGGISQALMTTVLGLIAAIPLTFLHSIVSGRSKAVVQVLEEQSAGIIARHAEKKG